MNDLVIERGFSVSAETLFDYVSQEANFQNWFGPEGTKVVDIKFKMEIGSDWHAEILGESGQRNKVSGKVLRFDPPKMLELTWAWRSDDGGLGPQSNVTLAVEADGEAASVLTLTHSGLADEDSRKNHNTGWSSSLIKLTKLIG